MLWRRGGGKRISYPGGGGGEGGNPITGGRKPITAGGTTIMAGVFLRTVFDKCCIWYLIKDIIK